MIKLREIIEDDCLLEVGRLAIEDELVRCRDDRIQEIRGNGLVIKERDGTATSIIRFGPETALRIGLVAIEEFLQTESRERSIVSFDGDYEFLSNFYPAPVMLDGISYPTTENAYQAAKTWDRTAFEDCSPAEAKKLGRKVKMIPDWDRVKVGIMRGLLAQKFEHGTELGIRLRATGSKRLVEGNTWNDTYWGVYKGVGANMLGRLLMNQRDYLNLYG